MKQLFQMRNLKLSNKFFFIFSTIFLSFFFLKIYYNEPVDIWNIDKKKTIENKVINEIEKKDSTLNSVYEMQYQKKNDSICTVIHTPSYSHL